MCQRSTFRNVVSFGQAAPTACPGCVLSNKNRMIPHRRLLAIIDGICLRQPFVYKITSMIENYRKAFIPEIFGFSAGKPKPAAKL